MTPHQPITVLTICREPLAIVLRFAAWHRRMGADAVRIHFDDPDDPAIAALAHFPWITSVRCDVAYWKRLGLKPDDPFQLRQVAALTDGYRTLQVGWVAVLDADELFYFSGRQFEEVLAKLPADVRSIRVRTAEHMVSDPNIVDKNLHFRLPMSKSEASIIYGEAGALFRPTLGLVGHNVGKSIIRAGLQIRRMRPHWAETGQERDLTDRILGPEAGAYLLHLISSDFGSWRGKLERRMSVPGGSSTRIKREVGRILLQSDDTRDAELNSLYRTLYVADQGLVDRLNKHARHFAVEDNLAMITNTIFDLPRS